MKVTLKDPPRKFKVGQSQAIELKDCGTVGLEANEQVTFSTPAGAEFDVSRKSWGFYAAPSLNGRLPKFGLRPALVTNKSTGHFFILLVEKNQTHDFEKYLAEEKITFLHWLDQKDILEKISTL